MSCDPLRIRMDNGFSFVECLVVVALLGILAALAIPSSGALQRRLELDSGLRRLRVGLDRGRMAAIRDSQPCALQLSASGWQTPLTDVLPGCRGGVTPLSETGAGALVLRSNLPDSVRFSSNGFVLDGGLELLSHLGHGQTLCMVIGLPLGITRTGVYRGDPSASLSSALCLPSDA